MFSEKLSDPNAKVQRVLSEGLHQISPPPHENQEQSTVPLNTQIPSNNQNTSVSVKDSCATKPVEIECQSSNTGGTLLCEEDKRQTTYYTAEAKGQEIPRPNIIGEALQTTPSRLRRGTDAEMDSCDILTSLVGGNHVPSAFGTSKVELLNDFGRYIGEIDPDTQQPQGEGTLYFREGSSYSGKWRDGMPEGLGEKHYENGDVYRGQWVAGKRCGAGEYFHANGHYFKGIYEDDKPNGYGIFVSVNKDRYEGMWRNGQKDGKGQEILCNGQRFLGRWRNGKKQGRGRLFLPGTTTSIYGVWNQDEFFRELSFAEMENELATDYSDISAGTQISPKNPFRQSTTFDPGFNEPERLSYPAEQGELSMIGNIGSKVVTGFMGGLNFIENRLAELGKVFEQVITPELPGTDASRTYPPAQVHFNEVATEENFISATGSHHPAANVAGVLNLYEGGFAQLSGFPATTEAMNIESHIPGASEDEKPSSTQDALYEMSLHDKMPLDEELNNLRRQ